MPGGKPASAVEGTLFVAGVVDMGQPGICSAPSVSEAWPEAKARHPNRSRQGCDKVDLSLRLVTQICNLLYRRFPIGRASEPTRALQVKNLRYSRLKICVTGALQV